MTTQHPERRLTTGDRWKLTSPVGGTADGVVALVDGVPRIVDGSGRAYVYGPNDKNVGHMWSRIDVPAAAPLAADRTKCAKWCGHLTDELDEDDPRRMGRPMGKGHAGPTTFVRDQRAVWCSPACLAARLPPLAAQPAETSALTSNRDCVCGGYHPPGLCSKSRQPAPQPAPAKPVTCVDCDLSPAPLRIVGTVQRPRPMCDDCYLKRESHINRDGLTNVLDDPKYPERLERPKLSHVAGMHDDDLIGVAR